MTGSISTSPASTLPSTPCTVTSFGLSPASRTVAVRVSWDPSSGVSGRPVLSTSAISILGHASSARRR
ncbi:Uncharacterised protein [Mycobacterium tuberculosis]|nr:Uncharacterised protein [Mycobacterium tuberculosis]